MRVDWILITVVASNLVCSTAGDVLAKLWGVTGNSQWFYIGMAVNVFTTFFFMAAIKQAGLAATTSVVLLLTIVINVTIGIVTFQETLTIRQWIGIAIGLVAILFIAIPSGARSA
jgi:drug/metabolite transporter (DMT)-like permease